MALITGSWWAVTLLGVMSVCAVVMTVTVCLAVRDLRRTMRHVNTMLPDCDKAVQDTRHTLAHIRRLLVRGDHAAHEVERVIHRACDAASAIIERVVFLKERAEDVLAGRFGNGARSGSRPRYHQR